MTRPLLLIFALAFAGIVWMAQEIEIPECDSTDELATILETKRSLDRIMEVGK